MSPPQPPLAPYPPASPVAEPTSEQTVQEVARNWLLTITFAFSIVLSCCLLFLCGRRLQKWKAVPVQAECPDEPPRIRVREHELWRRKCAERERQGGRSLSLAFDGGQLDTFQSLLSQ